MYETEKQQIIDCARKMERYGLIVLSGGNVSMRMPCGNYLVTPSAMSYDTMEHGDLVLIDDNGEVVDGKRRPTSDKDAVVYMFRHMPQVNVILHTHQPYATAVGLVSDRLPANLVTVVDELHDEVRVAPFTPSSDEGMGINAVEYAGNALAVILKHHGVLAYGRDLDQALAAAVYLEEAAKSYLAALASGRPVAGLTREQIEVEAAERGYYGQPGQYYK